MAGETIVRFEDVSYKYGAQKLILDDVSFGVRRGSKTTLMGQNGAGQGKIYDINLYALTWYLRL